MCVFNRSLIERLWVWNIPESLKIAWVWWAAVLLCGSVRWLQGLLQRLRTWDEAPSLKLWRALCYWGALPALEVHALWQHPALMPLVMRRQYPFLSIGSVPLTAASELRLTHADGVMSTLRGAQWCPGLHQASACHCYLLVKVNVSVWEELQTSVRRKMLQEWEKATVASCPPLRIILQYGGLRTLLKCLREAQTSTFLLWAPEDALVLSRVTKSYQTKALMAKTCPRQRRQQSTSVLSQWVSVNLSVPRRDENSSGFYLLLTFHRNWYSTDQLWRCETPNIWALGSNWDPRFIAGRQVTHQNRKTSLRWCLDHCSRSDWTIPGALLPGFLLAVPGCGLQDRSCRVLPWLGQASEQPCLISSLA